VVTSPIVSIDLFCGGGGASLGIRRATGRAPIVAINHSPAAICAACFSFKSYANGCMESIICRNDSRVPTGSPTILHTGFGSAFVRDAATPITQRFRRTGVGGSRSATSGKTSVRSSRTLVSSLRLGTRSTASTTIGGTSLATYGGSPDPATTGTGATTFGSPSAGKDAYSSSFARSAGCDSTPSSIASQLDGPSRLRLECMCAQRLLTAPDLLPGGIAADSPSTSAEKYTDSTRRAERHTPNSRRNSGSSRRSLEPSSRTRAGNSRSRIGNSVCPPVVEAIVRAQFAYEPQERQPDLFERVVA
jgi:hypothetical protein